MRAVFTTGVQTERALRAFGGAKSDISNRCIIAKAVEKRKVTIRLTSSESALQWRLQFLFFVIETYSSGFYLRVTKVANRVLFIKEEKNFTEKVLQNVRQNGFLKLSGVSL